jgi:hypothetical protein
LDYPHYTCRWKRRPSQKIKNYIATINGNHAYMTQDMKKETILQMGSDKMIPRHVYDKPLTLRFLDRSEWKEGFQPDRKGGLM